MHPLETFQRLNGETLLYAFFFGTIALFGILETIVTMRSYGVAHQRRWPMNWALTVLNTLLLGALPISALVLSDIVRDRGFGLLNQHSQPLYLLIREIRGAFNDLKAVSDQMNIDLGVTAAMRAVLEYVVEHGPHTVPQIAEAKNVTRQHIQLLCDALMEKRMVEVRENPRHKRSRLIAASDAGRNAFAAIRARETVVLSGFEAQLDDAELASAARTLAELRGLLAQTADKT